MLRYRLFSTEIMMTAADDVSLEGKQRQRKENESRLGFETR